MARVQSVILRKPHPGPDSYLTKREALDLNPGKVVVDAFYEEERQARNAADRLNLGLRLDWPSDTYYGIEAYVPDGDLGGSGTWTVSVGLLKGLPESLAHRVAHPSRRGRKEGVSPGPGGVMASEVILRDPPDGSEAHVSKGDALAAYPHRVVVDAAFRTASQARNAADRINLDLRLDWPSDTYYGIEYFPADSEEGTGPVEVLVGLRENMPPELEERVSAPGRKVRTATRSPGAGAIRVRDVVLRDAPRSAQSVASGRGDLYRELREQLERHPEMTVLDGVYPKDFPYREVVDPETGETVKERRPWTTEELYRNQVSAAGAEERLNLGERKPWPPETYYGAAVPELGEDGRPTGRYELQVGLRSHMPEGWRAKIEAADRRRARRSEQGEAS